MQVNTSNDVKIYNLSAGKSIPEWFSNKKRRELEKTDINFRRRIQLLQDFDMPEVSHGIQLTSDGRYIVASGAYKPRIRCFDTSEMSMKFERCMDSEILKFKVLSEDYSKLILLQSDRHLEFHSQAGRYHRLRIPKFGRDMSYQPEFCHLYVCGASREVYRLDLEQGKFVDSLISIQDTEMNSGDVNPVHQLYVAGTTSGIVEAWDPRSGRSVGELSCRLSDVMDDAEDSYAITKVKFKDSLNLAVGTSTGYIILYDIRSPKPYYIKDHNYSLPISSIEFIPELDYVATMDRKIMKIWERQTGKAVTSVEPGVDLNDMCLVPNSGMFFLANEAPKILSYFVPSIGPAPKWCGFLDSLTEELEESTETTIYDDYKFVTTDELETLGLSDLIGSNLLRAYMHGFFVDIRLYKKAKSIVEPFNYENFKQQKIKDTFLAERMESRVKNEKLPKVNRALAQKYLEDQQNVSTKKKTKKTDVNPLQDDRFGALFKNPDFEVDPTSDEYRLINPLVSKIDKRRQDKAADDLEDENEEDGVDNDLAPELEEDANVRDDSSESSDDDREWVVERRKQHKLIQEEQRSERRPQKPRNRPKPQIPHAAGRAEVREVDSDLMGKDGETKIKSLEDRLRESSLRNGGEETKLSGGNRQITFSTGYRAQRRREENEKHHSERRKIHRSGGTISSQFKKPWKGGKGK